MGDYKQDPWKFSDEEGQLVKDSKVRIYGFVQPPPEHMTNARCAARQPLVMTLEPGRYSWCSCGYSTKQPLCDAAHCLPGYNTNRSAYDFEVLEETELKLCRCKRTNTPPFCDGTHKSVRPDGSDDL